MMGYSSPVTKRPDKRQTKDSKPRRYNLNYMHDQPRILPNYGKNRYRLLPKTSLSKVLMYDNASQDKMLDDSLNQIGVDQYRAVRMFYLHRNSFLKQREKRMKNLQAISTRNRNQLKLQELQSSHWPKRSEHIGTLSSRSSSTLSFLNFLKFPQIDPRGDRRHVFYKFKGSDGRFNIFYSEDDGIFADVIPTHQFYPRTTDDPRFQELEESLEAMSIEYGGYSELSPSYKHQKVPYPEHIHEIRRIARTKPNPEKA